MREVIGLFAHDRGLITDELIELCYQASLSPPVRDSWAAMVPGPRQRWVDDLALSGAELAAISAPALLVHGRDDRVVPWRVSSAPRRARARAASASCGAQPAQFINSHPIGCYLAQAAFLLLSAHAVANYLTQFYEPVTRACNSRYQPLAVHYGEDRRARPAWHESAYAGGIGARCHPVSHNSFQAAIIWIESRVTSGCSQVAVLMTKALPGKTGAPGQYASRISREGSS